MEIEEAKFLKGKRLKSFQYEMRAIFTKFLVQESNEGAKVVNISALRKCLKLLKFHYSDLLPIEHHLKCFCDVKLHYSQLLKAHVLTVAISGIL